MSSLFLLLVLVCLASVAMGFAPSSSRMSSQKVATYSHVTPRYFLSFSLDQMVMLFNFGKKSASTSSSPKVAAKPTSVAKPAAKPGASAFTNKAAAVKVAAAAPKSTTPAYTKPNPTPEAYVDSSSDFFSFSRSLPAWLKKKST